MGSGVDVMVPSIDFQVQLIVLVSIVDSVIIIVVTKHYYRINHLIPMIFRPPNLNNIHMDNYINIEMFEISLINGYSGRIYR